jgi:hypothetical protein
MEQVRKPALEETALTAEIGRRGILNPVYITIDKQSRAQCESRLAMEPQSVCGVGDRKDTKVAIDVKIYHTISL